MLRALKRAVRRHVPREPRPYRFPIRASYVWGACDRGQLGLGVEHASQPTPVRLPLPEGHEFIEIAGGPNHLFARTKANRWFGWGVGTSGAFGDRRKSNYSKPTLIEELNDATQVACGGYHTLMHKGDEGETFASGEGTGGCLGLGDAISESRFRRLSELRGIKLRQLVAGVDFSLFLTDRTREVLATGRNDVGQLGLGHIANSMVPTPLRALGGIPISSLASGWGHTLALTDEGSVYAWGANRHGQCGVGHNFTVLEPQSIPFLRDRHIVQISAGSTHSAALSDEGLLYVWGSHGDGKLGFGDQEPADVLSPRVLELSRQRPVQNVVLGVDHSLTLTKTGELWAWGFGQHGVLGLAERADRPVPVQVPWAAGWAPSDLIAGMDYSLAFVATPNSEYDDE